MVSSIHHSTRRGLSLPEIAIAMVVFSILVIAGLGAFRFSQQTIWDVNKEKHARDIALAQMEVLLDQGYYEATSTGGAIDTPYSDTRDGTTYTVSYTTNQLEDPANSNTYDGDPFWKVVVSVSYGDKVYSLDCIIGE